MKSECEIYHDGNKFWFFNGELHREDGPAIEWCDGDTEWILNGKRHREDGPALEFTNGVKCWYLNGKIYSESEYYKKLYELGKMSEEDYFLRVL